MPPSRGKGRASDAMRRNLEKILRRDSGMPGTRVISANRVGTDATGKPVYVIRYQVPRPYGVEPAILTRTHTLSGGQLGKPSYESGLPPSDDGRTGGGGGGRGDVGTDPLQARKDMWLRHVASNPNLSAAHKQDLSNLIDEYDGGLLQLNNFVKRYIESATNAPPPDSGSGFQGSIDIGGGGGGGGGGGFTGPTYRAPDKRVVESFVKGEMVDLLGTVHPGLVGQAVSIYMNDHRRDFDSEGQAIDPAQSVIEFIRNTEDYQELHALRPESEDERNWVGARRRAAQQGGLEVDEREEFARVQSAVGGDVADVRDAAALQQTASSGSTRGTLLESKVKGVAQAIFQGVR